MPSEYFTNPLAILDTAGETVKALARRKVSFAPQTGSSPGSLNVGFLPGGLINTGLPSMFGDAPNYFGNVADPMGNRIIAACVNAKATAMASAPAILQQFEDGQWKQVDHEAVDLLNTPNPYHSYFDCQYATTALEDTTGEAYWRIEFDGRQMPGEIWTEHPGKFQVVGTTDEYISGYKFQQEAGGVIELEDRDVIHFRRALNLHNARNGWTPLFAGNPQVHGDNAASVYQAAVLDNAGVMSLLISLREQLQSQQGVVTNQIKEMVEALKRKLRGPGAGAIVGLNLPVDVHKMGYSPDEMAIDKLIRYFTTTICALLEVDPIIIHMASGPDSPTYANFKEAVEDFWSRTIVPTNMRRDAVLRTQYLPLWNLDPAEYRISRDYSQIPAMQEDKAQLSGKVCGEYKAGIIDRYTAKNALHYDVSDEDKGVYAAPAKPGDAADGEAPDAVAGKAWRVTSVKELPLKEIFSDSYYANGRIGDICPDADSLKLWQESDHPRSDDGKFGHGGGGTKVSELMTQALSKQNLSESKKAEYSQTMRDAMQRMSHSNLRTIGDRLNQIKFYEDTDTLDSALSTSLSPVDGTFGGGFNSDTGVLHLNGGDDAAGIYSHELSHVLDIAKDGETKISDTSEWQAAWQSEIVEGAKISNHAASSESEGFAEFGRLVFGGYQSESETKREFPKAYAVWQAHGLRESATKSWDESQHPRDPNGEFAHGSSGGQNSGMSTHNRIAELEKKYSQAQSKEREYWQANKKEIAKEDKDFSKGNRKDRPLFMEYLRLGQESTTIRKELDAARAQTADEPKAPTAPREIIRHSDTRTPGTVLVARFSDDIDADIKRGWSAYQHPALGGTRAEVERDAREMNVTDPDIRKLPGGGYALVHHEGLSAYPISSESVDGAQQEVLATTNDGSGYGHRTTGKIRKMRTIPKELIGSIRDLHILEVSGSEVEQMGRM